MTVVINGTTGVSGVAGSASTPALIGSDADSGYYINSANEPNASVNGAAVWSAASSFGFKNRIINGRMEIDQRNAGASVSNANGYTLDRWYLLRGASSSSPVFNVQQSTTVPSNYKNSLLVTVGTSGAPGANNYSALYQSIEGLNVADFGWGTATATAITVSFWVNCSVTGTYGMSFQNSALNRSYIATYTVNAANTWEQKTVTIAGDTSGTWLTTNGVGLNVYWDLGVGTGQSTTAGTWQAGNYLGLTGGTKLSNTGSATFYITGVQLEKGSTATSFDYRPYGTELALCQRYFARFNSLNGSYRGIGAGVTESATSISCVVKYPVAMRSGPTASGANLATYDGGSVRALTAFSTQYPGSDGININLTAGGGGMTQFRPANLISDNSGTGYFDLSAEL